MNNIHPIFQQALAPFIPKDQTMPKIIDREPRAYIGVKMDDGSAELLHATFGPGPRITGDGTLQHPLTAVLEVTLKQGEQYGVAVYKPGCKVSEGFARIAKTTTITPACIHAIKDMGYVVKVEGKPEVTL
jgi:hypothetical protein